MIIEVERGVYFRRRFYWGVGLVVLVTFLVASLGIVVRSDLVCVWDSASLLICCGSPPGTVLFTSCLDFVGGSWWFVLSESGAFCGK